MITTMTMTTPEPKEWDGDKLFEELPFTNNREQAYFINIAARHNAEVAQLWEQLKLNRDLWRDVPEQPRWIPYAERPPTAKDANKYEVGRQHDRMVMAAPSADVFSPDQRAKYEKLRTESMQRIRPLLDAARRSSMIGREDLGIIIR